MAAQTTGFGKMNCASLRYPAIFLSMLGLLAQPAVAQDDDYLSEISAEASKIDSKLPTQGEAESNQDGLADEGAAQVAFEEDLKSRYLGSYTFYKKLPRRAREEVYEEYKGGASIDEIRQKIMNRFLNQ
ncbi:MAG: hypothetical protein KUF72_19630 [Candidatus Thiodiazotropha sp. (ex Ctena orbiculata)]|nr:hypothetical protein [Candidatus Thiodiazotropha taylori]